ncbi:MAG: methyltransferase domain-containing protein [Polyangia bacterium]
MDWNPQQYGKFGAEREAPVADLMALFMPTAAPGMRVVDLGCGPGRFTLQLAARLPQSKVIGIDSSPSMLSAATPGGGVDFVEGTIEAFADGGVVDGDFDLVFSNSALHWVPDHVTLVGKLWARLRPGGQLAVQLPADDFNSSRKIFADVAGWRHEMATLDIAEYAQLLYAAGAADATAYEKIYPHLLADADAVLEWSKGTALLPYLERLPPAQHAPYLEEVRRRLHARYPERPVFFPFRRIIFYGRRA